MSDPHKPKPPTVVPILFLTVCLILGVTYWAMNQIGLPGVLVAGFLPLTFAMLPAEIRYSLRRRQICEHIAPDFADQDMGLETDYEMMLAEVRNPTVSRPSHPRRSRLVSHSTGSTRPSGEPLSQDSISWPSTVG